MSETVDSANCSNCSSCTFLTLEEQIFLWDVKFWTEGVVQLSLAVIGVITNLVSIYVLSRKELSNTFNQLLITLAIFDILYLLIMFLDSIGQVFLPYSTGQMPSWYKLFTPYVLYPGKAISLTCSIFMMVSIGVERYTAVYYPFSRIPLNEFVRSKNNCFKKRLFIYIFPVVFFSIGLNTFKFLESEANWKEGSVQLDIREIRYDPVYLIVNSWVRLLVLGVAPVTAIITLNCSIYCAVRRARMEMIGHGLGGKERRMEDVDEKGMAREASRKEDKNDQLLAGEGGRRSTKIGHEMVDEGVRSDNIQLTKIAPDLRKKAQLTEARTWNTRNMRSRRKHLSKSEQRLSIVLIMIAVIFIISSVPRIIIMMYDIIIIDTVRSCIAEGFLGEGFPAWNHILGYVSHVLLCFVPTANFLVYCVVGNKFRSIASIYIQRIFCCKQPPRWSANPRLGSLRSSCRTTSPSCGNTDQGSLRGSVKSSYTSQKANGSCV